MLSLRNLHGYPKLLHLSLCITSYHCQVQLEKKNSRKITVSNISMIANVFGCIFH
jgi:hypothetical protein